MAKNQQDDILISYMTRFSGLLEKHLVAVRTLMSSTVASVMESALEMEQTAAITRKNAEERLAASRDATSASEATTLAQGVRQAVAGLFDEARESAELNRSNALNGLDEKLSALAVNAMGALSSEDVMIQRIEHIIMAARGLETALSYLLLDYSRRNTDERVATMMNDLLDFTFRQYTSEEEKREFFEVFPEWKDAA